MQKGKARPGTLHVAECTSCEGRLIHSLDESGHFCWPQPMPRGSGKPVLLASPALGYGGR